MSGSITRINVTNNYEDQCKEQYGKGLMLGSMSESMNEGQCQDQWRWSMSEMGVLGTIDDCAASSSHLAHWLFQYPFGFPYHTFELTWDVHFSSSYWPFAPHCTLQDSSINYLYIIWLILLVNILLQYRTKGKSKYTLTDYRLWPMAKVCWFRVNASHIFYKENNKFLYFFWESLLSLHKGFTETAIVILAVSKNECHLRAQKHLRNPGTHSVKPAHADSGESFLIPQETVVGPRLHHTQHSPRAREILQK